MIALTRILSRNEEVAARSYVEQAGYAVLPGCIREHAAYRDAQNKGRALNETDVKNLNADVDDVLTALLGFATRSAAGVVTNEVVIKSDSGGAA